MTVDRPAPAVGTAEWLDLVRRHLNGDAQSLPLSADERSAILDLARVAAHTSERITAPLSAYLAGLALAAVPAAERADRMAELVAKLEAEAA